LKSNFSKGEFILKSENKGILYMLAASILWSTGGLLIKYIPLSSIVLSSIRSLIGLTVIILFNYKSKIIINRSVLLSAFCLAYTLTSFVIANRYTTAASAIVLQYCSPICIAFYLFLLYKRKPERNKIIALSGAFVGIVLFFFGKFSSGSLFGNLLALSAGFSFGGMFIINSNSNCDTYSSLVIGQLITFIIGFPFLFSQSYNLMPSAIIALIFLGVFQVGVAYVCFSKGIKRVSPLSANIICMIEPVISPIWVFIFLGEVPTINAIIGSVIVISSVAFLNITQAKQIKIT